MKMKQAQLRVMISEESSHMTSHMTVPLPLAHGITSASDLPPWSHQVAPTGPAPHLYPYDRCWTIHVRVTVYLLWWTLYIPSYIQMYIILSAHAQQGLVCHSVPLSVRLLPRFFCHHTQQGSKKAIPTGSVPHWLDFKLCTRTVFKSYGVETKWTSQYASEHGITWPDSAHFENGGGSRSNTKGEYVVLVC